VDGLFLFYPRSDQRQFGVAAADVNLGRALSRRAIASKRGWCISFGLRPSPLTTTSRAFGVKRGARE
jgi:hypothetical protein